MTARSRALTGNTETTCSGLETGSGRSSTVLTRLKMEVLTPMPSAKERMATVVKPGLARNRRIPKRMSFSSSIMRGR